MRGSGSCTGSNASWNGTPYCPTLITVANGLLPYTGGLCGLNTSVEVACPGAQAIFLINPIGNNYGYSWAQCGNPGSNPASSACGAVQLAADAAQGATTVQVIQTSAFSVGMWVLIDEASGAQWQLDPMTAFEGFEQVWAAPDWLSSSGSPATGRVEWPKYYTGTAYGFNTTYPYQTGSIGCWFSYCDRPTAELHKIASIGAGPCPGTSCTLTFDDPLTIGFRRSGPYTFTGTISGTTLTTTGDACSMAVGQLVESASTSGTQVSGGTYTTAVKSCSGGAGNYTVNNAQTVAGQSMLGGAHQAQIYPGPFHNQQGTRTPGMLQYAGLENLSLSRPNASAIQMQLCVYCWLKNIDAYYWSNDAISVEYTARSEFTGSTSTTPATRPTTVASIRSI